MSYMCPINLLLVILLMHLMESLEDWKVKYINFKAGFSNPAFRHCQDTPSYIRLQPHYGTSHKGNIQVLFLPHTLL